MSRRTVAVALLLWAGLAPALAEDPPAATRPRLLQRVSKPDAKAAAAEVTAAGLEPDAVVLPTDTEYNDPRRADAVAAAAEALFAAGVPEIWLEIGVAGQTLDPENALTAARVYLKRVPRAKGLVVHWLFPRRFLSPPQSAEPWLRKFAEIGLPLIGLGGPQNPPPPGVSPPCPGPGGSRSRRSPGPRRTSTSPRASSRKAEPIRRWSAAGSIPSPQPPGCRCSPACASARRSRRSRSTSPDSRRFSNRSPPVT